MITKKFVIILKKAAISYLVAQQFSIVKIFCVFNNFFKKNGETCKNVDENWREMIIFKLVHSHQSKMLF